MSTQTSYNATPLVGDGGVLQGTRTITTFPHTLSSADDGEILLLDSASAAVVNVPVNLPPRFGCAFVQIGAGAVTITEVGTTVSSSGDLFDTGGPDTMAALIAKGTDEFSLIGALA